MDDKKKILIQSIKYFKVFEVCQWFHLLWVAYLFNGDPFSTNFSILESEFGQQAI